MCISKHIIGTLIFAFACTFCTDAQSKKAYVKAADNAIEKGDIASAAAYYSKALAFNEQDFELQMNAADCYRKLNNYFLASEHYEKVVESNAISKYKDALFYLGELKKHFGEYKEAKLLFEKYLKEDADENSILHQKAKTQIKSCEWALTQKFPNGLKVHALDGKINTPNTEFAPYLINDSIIYYSSLSFESDKLPDDVPSTTISKILRSMDGSRGWTTGKPLKSTFNRNNSHNCNATLSSDGKLMLFTRCNYNSKNELECKLYESSLVNGKWQSPKKVDSKLNKRGYTSTHPSIANLGAEGYIVYFVSNRPNGFGGLDIWESKRNAIGAYSEPINLGSVINTVSDEITPFYHHHSNTLYFSSKAHVGFGGFDILKSKATNFTYYKVENAGHYINSPFNDQYAALNTSGSKLVFSSNRPELNTVVNETCCYDLFSFQFSDTIQEVDVDTANIAVIDSTTQNDEFETLSSFVPIKLFFHNDEPDNNTWNTETEKSYLETYYAFTGMQSIYELNYSSDNKNFNPTQAKERINNFFNLEVKGGYERLEKFSSRLLIELENGKSMKVMVRGYTSPLAATDYNFNLSKRRISSLKNHLKSYKNGAFLPFISSKQLQIKEEPAGETYVLPGVSDELEDATNSIFSPEAARERRIEITRVIISE